MYLAYPKWDILLLAWELDYLEEQGAWTLIKVGDIQFLLLFYPQNQKMYSPSKFGITPIYYATKANIVVDKNF